MMNFSHIKELCEDRGMDHYFAQPDKIDLHSFKRMALLQTEDKFQLENACFTSLQKYNMLKECHYEAAPYLFNTQASYKSIRLKCKMRLGVSGLGDDLYRQHRDTGRCRNCNEFESMKHFMFKCPAYENERHQMLTFIKTNTSETVFNDFIQDLYCALYSLLGDHDNVFNVAMLTYLDSAWNVRSKL